MKILILNWRDPKHPRAGGAEQVLYHYALYWIRKGAQVWWFSSSFAQSNQYEIIDHIVILRGGNEYTVHIHALIRFSQKRFMDFDIVVDCFHFIPFFSPFYIRGSQKVAFICEVAGRLWFANLPLPFSWIGYILERYFFKIYRNIHFLTISVSTQKELIKCGVKKRDITIITSGVSNLNPERKYQKSSYPSIIFLGRASKDKGIEEAFKVFELVKKNISKLQFWVAGKEENNLLSNLKTLYKDKSIIYYGYVSEKRKFELLSRAWILIHPSIKEGWGLNAVEAATVSTPTVGYNVPGLSDSIKNNITGFLCSPNPKSMAKDVIRLIDDRQLYNKLSRNAKKWSFRFNWEKSGELSWKILKDLYEKNK